MQPLLQAMPVSLQAAEAATSPACRGRAGLQTSCWYEGHAAMTASNHMLQQLVLICHLPATTATIRRSQLLQKL